MNTKKVRILIVDEQDTFFRLLSEHAEMSRHDYDVECCHAASGVQALELMRAWHPSIVLLDVHLPDVSGFEILDRCKEGFSAVVMTSDACSKEIEESARTRGAHGYLPKLCNPDELDEVLSFLVDVAPGDTLVQ